MGGAIYNLGTLIISGGTFNQNGGESVLGGAIANEGELTISQVTASGNTSLSGGFLYNNISTQITIQDSILTNNSAAGSSSDNSGNGGAISIILGELQIENVEMTDNTARDYGGALYLASGRNNNLLLIDCNIDLNTSAYGGGVSIGGNGSSNSTQTIFIENVSFDQNVSSGALYVSSGNAQIMDMSITNTTGYGMYVASGSVEISREIIISNNTYNDGNSNLYLIGESGITISSPLIGQSSIGVSVENASERAIIESNGNYIIKSSDFEKFSSDRQGQAIYFRVVDELDGTQNAIFVKDVSANSGIVYVVSDFYGENGDLGVLERATIRVEVFYPSDSSVSYSLTGGDDYTSSPIVATSAGVTTIYYRIETGSGSATQTVNGSGKVVITETNSLYVYTLPNVENVYINTPLSNAEINGGIAMYNGVRIAGNFSFVNGDYEPSTAGKQIFEMVFTPKNTEVYAPVQFEMLVDVIGYNVLYFKEFVSSGSMTNNFYLTEEDANNAVNAVASLSASSRTGFSDIINIMTDGGVIYMMSGLSSGADIYVNDSKTITLRRYSNFSAPMFSAYDNTTIIFGSSNMSGNLILDGNNIESDYPIIEYRRGMTGSATQIIYDGVSVVNHIGLNVPAIGVVGNVSLVIYNLNAENCHYIDESETSGESYNVPANLTTGGNIKYSGGGVLSTRNGESSSVGEVAPTINIYNMVANNCSSDSETYGGVLSFSSDGSRNPSSLIVITNMEISNSSAEYGGGIATTIFNNLTIYNMTLSSNSATNGGGIYLTDMESIYQATIEGNSATYGGGMYLAGRGFSASVVGQNSENLIKIINNEATINGGGIFALNPFAMSYAMISGNTIRSTSDSSKLVYGAGISGAGIFVDELSSSSDALLINNSTISSNTIISSDTTYSVYGAGIYSKRVNLNQVEIFNNGIILSTSQELMSSMFLMGAGLCLYSIAGESVITNSNIHNNFIMSHNGKSFSGGAGIALIGSVNSVSGPQNVNLTNSEVMNNYISSVEYSSDTAENFDNSLYDQILIQFAYNTMGVSDNVYLNINGSVVSSSSTEPGIGSIGFNNLSFIDTIKSISSIFITGESYILAPIEVNMTNSYNATSPITVLEGLSEESIINIYLSGTSVVLYSQGETSVPSTIIKYEEEYLTTIRNEVEAGLESDSGEEALQEDIDAGVIEILNGVFQDVFILTDGTGQNRRITLTPYTNSTIDQLVNRYTLVPTLYGSQPLAVVYWNPQATSSGNGNSEQTAVRTLDEALSRVQKGGEIRLVNTWIIEEDTVATASDAVISRYNASANIIVRNGATLELSNITFDGNSDEFENSMIVVENGGELILSDGVVIRNNTLSVQNIGTNESGSVIHNEGRVTINGGSYYSNSVLGYVDQGGFMYSSGEVYINGGIFHSNFARYGGAIYVDGGVVEISNGTFANNSAVTSNAINDIGLAGGAIYVTKDARLVISDGVFSGNNSVYGGAIYSKGEVEISGGRFINNIAVDALLPSTSQGSLNSVYVGGEGGAIFVSDGTINITGGAFYSNEATLGGAIVVGGNILPENASNNNRISASITGNVLIIDNYARAFDVTTSVYATQSQISASATVAADMINDNHSYENGGGRGGAIFISAFAKLEIKNGNIGGNKAARSGGAIYADGGVLLISGGAIFDNMAGFYSTQSADVAVTQVSSMGGAIYYNGKIVEGYGSFGEANKGDILDNTDTGIKVNSLQESNFIISGGLIEGNFANNGAAIFITGTLNPTALIISGGKINANGSYDNANNVMVSNASASTLGGALYLSENAFVEIRDGAFITNNKANDGGAIYTNTGSRLLVSGGEITGNSVVDPLSNGNLEVNSSTSATAIAVTSGEVVLYGGIISDNYSTGVVAGAVVVAASTMDRFLFVGGSVYIYDNIIKKAI